MQEHQSNTQAMRFSCPAKINLFLHILGQRPDGYHELETIFQLLDWGDDLSLKPSTDRHIYFEQTPRADFPIEENLVFKAARLLQQKTDGQKGAHIKLEKRIPIGAGLGGGSSNAATTLLALNQLWGTKLSIQQLCDIGLKLGADVPVFIQGQSAFAKGIGEKLEPIILPKSWFLVFTPAIQVSTAQIFSNPQLTRDNTAIKIRALATKRGFNDCQKVVERLYPEIAKARKWLEKFAPVKMSGTGSSLYLECEDKGQAEQILNNIGNEHAGTDTFQYSAFIAQGINRSPVFAEIDKLCEL